LNIKRTTYYGIISIVIKTISQFILNKAFAVFIGVSKFSLIGNFQSLIAISTTFSTFGLNSAIVKYTSEHKESSRKFIYWSTSLVVSLFCLFFTFLILFFGSEKISLSIFKTDSYSYIIKIFSFSILFFTINKFLMSILNGMHKIKNYAIAEISNNIISVLLAIILIYFFKIDGALVALVLNQTISIIITYFLSKNFLKSFKNIFSFDFKIFKNLSQFTLMALITSVLNPLIMIILRNHLVKEYSFDYAGNWDALIKLSNLYLLFILYPISVYYLPKLSISKTFEELKSTILISAKFLIPATLIILIGVYLFSDLIIIVAFSKDFLLIKEFITLQLIGDFFRVLIWIVSYYFISKKMTKYFVTSELSINLSYLLISFYFIYIDYKNAIVFAYVVNNIIFATTLICILYFKIFRRLNNPTQ
jgi:PST family polysaccharide transporter